MLSIKANKLSQMQKEFNDYFPFLKLEFFNQKHSVYLGSPKHHLIKEDIYIEPEKSGQDSFLINENMSVWDIEQLFLNRFGISAQVFRKSGNSWLETTMTDDWTLKKQNDEGKELSVFGKI